MERYIILLDWKKRYCQNDYTSQGKLQIKHNPYLTTNGIFHWTRTTTTKKYNLYENTKDTK